MGLVSHVAYSVFNGSTDPQFGEGPIVSSLSWVPLHIETGKPRYLAHPFGRIQSPEGPSTQYVRSLVPDTIKGMVFGTRNRKYWVLGPCGKWWGLVAFQRHAQAHFMCQFR